MAMITRLAVLIGLLSSWAVSADTWLAPVTLVFHQTYGPDVVERIDPLRCTGTSQFHCQTGVLTMPPEGFTETVTTETITVAGTAFACRKRVWTRSDAGIPVIRCKRITAWTSDQIDAPEFEVPAVSGLPVPAGCVRYLAEPVEAGDAQADDFSVANAVAVKLVWKAKQDLTVGTRHIPAQRYAFDLISGHDKSTGTLDVSPAIDGGIAGFDLQARGTWSGQTGAILVSADAEPDPPGIVAYDGGRFGFAPPAPMVAAPAQPGELCRFAAGDSWLAIATFDPAGKTADDWFSPQIDALTGQQPQEAFPSAYYFWVLSSLSVGFQDQATGMEHHYLVHAGRGYAISFNDARALNWTAKQALLANWRWAAGAK